MSDMFTEEDVREQFVAGAMLTGAVYSRDEARRWFDEWLEDHTRHMQARVLIEETDLAEGMDLRTYQYLRSRARALTGGRAKGHPK